LSLNYFPPQVFQAGEKAGSRWQKGGPENLPVEGELPSLGKDGYGDDGKKQPWTMDEDVTPLLKNGDFPMLC